MLLALLGLLGLLLLWLLWLLRLRLLRLGRLLGHGDTSILICLVLVAFGKRPTHCERCPLQPAAGRLRPGCRHKLLMTDTTLACGGSKSATGLHHPSGHRPRRHPSRQRTLPSPRRQRTRNPDIGGAPACPRANNRIRCTPTRLAFYSPPLRLITWVYGARHTLCCRHPAHSVSWIPEKKCDKSVQPRGYLGGISGCIERRNGSSGEDDY